QIELPALSALGRLFPRRAVQHRLLCSADAYDCAGHRARGRRFRPYAGRCPPLQQSFRTGPAATQPRSATIVQSGHQPRAQADRGFRFRGFHFRRLRSASPHHRADRGMSRALGELTALVAEVADTYASRNAIARDDDWYLLKIQEELGELVAEYLKTTARGRHKG